MDSAETKRERHGFEAVTILLGIALSIVLFEAVQLGSKWFWPSVEGTFDGYRLYPYQDGRDSFVSLELTYLFMTKDGELRRGFYIAERQRDERSAGEMVRWKYPLGGRVEVHYDEKCESGSRLFLAGEKTAILRGLGYICTLVLLFSLASSLMGGSPVYVGLMTIPGCCLLSPILLPVAIVGLLTSTSGRTTEDDEQLHRDQDARKIIAEVASMDLPRRPTKIPLADQMTVSQVLVAFGRPSSVTLNSPSVLTFDYLRRKVHFVRPNSSLEYRLVSESIATTKVQSEFLLLHAEEKD